QRPFDGFEYQAGSWPAPRRVVVKAEAPQQGTNRRFVVSNRPGARLLPAAAYDDYALRGESEHRNKELKCDPAIDRTSHHRIVVRLSSSWPYPGWYEHVCRYLACPCRKCHSGDFPCSDVAPKPRRRFFFGARAGRGNTHGCQDGIFGKDRISTSTMIERSCG